MNAPARINLADMTPVADVNLTAIFEREGIRTFKKVAETALTRIQGEYRSGETVSRCDCGEPATTKYDGDDMCEPCARYCAKRDFEEGDMPGGFGE